MTTTTDTELTAALAEVTADQIESAYKGTAGKCSCGCSGTFYGPDYEDDPAMVASILRKVQKRAAKALTVRDEEFGTHEFADGSRVWFYGTSQHLFRVETGAVQR